MLRPRPSSRGDLHHTTRRTPLTYLLLDLSLLQIINVAEKSYPSDGLKNQVLDFGWPDHMAPPIDRLLGCIQAMDGWNRSDDSNVTVVHCKGGKGRTGVVIAAYMLQVKNFVGPYGADDAMDHFAITRFDSKDPMKYGISGVSCGFFPSCSRCTARRTLLVLPGLDPPACPRGVLCLAGPAVMLADPLSSGPGHDLAERATSVRQLLQGHHRGQF